MRSRDGGCTLLFTISLILASPLCAKQYQIGYRFSTANSIAYSETLQITPAMRDCKEKIDSNFLILPRKEDDSIEMLLQKNKNLFIEHFGINAAYIKSNDSIQNNYHNYKTTLTIPTKCYEIELNDNFATITLLN